MCRRLCGLLFAGDEGYLKKDWLMKKILCALLFLAAMVSTVTVVAADDERPIGVEELPAAAREFVARTFPTAKVVWASIDTDFLDRDYKVALDDGTLVEFDRGGQWKDIDCRHGQQVPAAVVPEAIRTYLERNYPGESLLQLDRDRRGYDVKLANGLEIEFDRDFRVVEIDR